MYHIRQGKNTNTFWSFKDINVDILRNSTCYKYRIQL